MPVYKRLQVYDSTIILIFLINLSTSILQKKNYIKKMCDKSIQVNFMDFENFKEAGQVIFLNILVFFISSL